MNITRNNVDALNAVVTVEVSKADYAPQVDKVLKNYLKTASIPGFRKGAVPMKRSKRLSKIKTNFCAKLRVMAAFFSSLLNIKPLSLK